MGFVKSSQEIAASRLKNLDFYGAEALTVLFLTKPEVLQRVLPPPLKPAAIPLCYAILINYPRTNFGAGYLESSLFVSADFNGETGLYCLAMPVTSDIGLIYGREIFGYPKKIGEISLRREGNEVSGWTQRHGFRFLDVRAKLTGAFNDQVAQTANLVTNNPDLVVFTYKYFQSPTMKGFDYNPRLIRGVTKSSPISVEFGEAEVVFGYSPHDPWAEIEIVKVLGATYSVSNLTMMPGTVVAEVTQDEFAPYEFMKIDGLP